MCMVRKTELSHVFLPGVVGVGGITVVVNSVGSCVDVVVDGSPVVVVGP